MAEYILIRQSTIRDLAMKEVHSEWGNKKYISLSKGNLLCSRVYAIDDNYDEYV